MEKRLWIAPLECYLNSKKVLLIHIKKIGYESGRLLLVYIPAGFENFYRDLNMSQIEKLKRFGADDPVIVQLLDLIIHICA